MDEKTMVNDILAGVKSDLTAYQTAISEAENMQLRQTFQQIRNNDESFQYELFKIAQSKGYYIPAQKATTTEVNTDVSKWTFFVHFDTSQKNRFEKERKNEKNKVFIKKHKKTYGN